MPRQIQANPIAGTGRRPRYTSYPTALQFGPAVGAADYGRWLAGLAGDCSLSLYFHIPFCHSMCWFCGCYTKIVQRYEPVAGYLRALHKEIGLVAARLSGRGLMRHLHLGGGSPTMLKGPDFAALADHVRQRFDFAADAEFAVEVDPRTATRDTVQAMAAAGVNRVSLGVRISTKAFRRRPTACSPSRPRAGPWTGSAKPASATSTWTSLYGLPLQTTERLLRTVDLAAELRPSRIALFGYAHMPWMKPHQKMIHDGDLPDLPARAEQAVAASKKLAGQGYVAIGLDHFARAIGALPQGYVQNLSPLKAYAKTVGSGALPIARGVVAGAGDRLRRAIIERLMCDLGVDLDAVCRAQGMEGVDFNAELSALAPLEADGLVRLDGARLTVPEDARFLVLVVCVVFDQYQERFLPK